MHRTPQQSTIIEAINSGNLCINARAGCGKTSTAAMAAPYMQAPTILASAFNKKNALDLEAKLPPNITCATHNSLGHRAVASLLGKRPRLATSKLFRLAKDMTLKHKEFGDTLKLARAARIAGLVPSSCRFSHKGLLPDTPENWEALADTNDCDAPIYLARNLLSISISATFAGTIDFDDQLYFAACFGAPLPTFSLGIVDEAQDLNALQHRMMERCVKDSLIYIGDPAQAIYAFRGALCNSMDLLAKTFPAPTLPLSVSFRCPKAVIEEAQAFVPDIQPFEGAPDGSVQRLQHDWALEDLRSATVLCRTNAPLLSLAMALLAAGIPCEMAGRDLGKSLAKVVKEVAPSSTTIQEFKTALARWADRKIQAKPKRVHMIQDQENSLLALASGCPDTTTLLARIKEIFSPTTAANPVHLSTIHRAKGLEWPKIFILNVDLIGGWPNQSPEQVQQERNLHYVAITRAQQDLIYINRDMETS